MNKEKSKTKSEKKISKNEEAIIRLNTKLITDDGAIFLYPDWQEDLRKVLACAIRYEEFIKSEDWE